MKILFLCTHNACRSIVAEAVASRIGAGRLQARSAGAAPAGVVHPDTLHYLAAAGYATDACRSKAIDDLQSFAPDVVITVCDSAAAEACPLWLGPALKVHWGLPDPSHSGLQGADKTAAFEQLIQCLEARIQRLMATDFEAMTAPEWQPLLTAIGADN